MISVRILFIYLLNRVLDIMKQAAIIYYSRCGHTKKIAEHIDIGIKKSNKVFTSLISVDELFDINILNDYKAIILGAPTYMGSVPYQFKKFMDNSSRAWLKQSWKDKLSAGFTNSGSLGGDKFNVLMQLCTFACQHGMLWLSLGITSDSISKNNHTTNNSSKLLINRMGGSIGLMTQSGNDSPEVTPPIEDKKTAELFGSRIAKYIILLS